MPASEPKPAFIHERAICDSRAVGAGTRVWAFAHILAGATIGADCNICDHVFIENDVVVGDRVTIKSGVQLWDGLRVADDVFIGPNATFSNDKFPRSKQHQARVDETHIARGASIGAGAVVLPGLKIGARAMIGAGAVVTHDVPARAIVFGNPGRISGYVDTVSTTEAAKAPVAGPDVRPTSVRGVTVHRLPIAEDLRGRLSAGEVGAHIPFAPNRYFVVFDVPGKHVRGEHAHRQCHQFLVAVRGSITVVVDDGTNAEEVVLDEPNVGIYVPPGVWAIQYRYSPDAVLLVLASHPYDPADYVRDYDEFIRTVAGARR
jgi:UDP-2-acetamido-3-amino-2,3-dideoxy-glucuronate N-acetyltransferase